MVLGAGLLVGLVVLCWPPGGQRQRIAWAALTTSPARGAARAAGGPSRRIHAWVERIRGSGRAARDDLIVQILNGVAAGLSAGLPPALAVESARQAFAPTMRELPSVSQGLDEVVAAGRDGEPLAPIWSALGRELDSTVLVQVGRAWAVSERLGSPLTEAVRATLDAHEASARLERAFVAQSAGPRATVQVLTALPILGLLLMPVIGVDYAAAYPPAVLLLAVVPGLVLLAIGRAVSKRMVARALRTPTIAHGGTS